MQEAAPAGLCPCDTRLLCTAFSTATGFPLTAALIRLGVACGAESLGRVLAGLRVPGAQPTTATTTRNEATSRGVSRIILSFIVGSR